MKNGTWKVLSRTFRPTAIIAASMPTWVIVFVATALLFLGCGCVERTISITSEPSGALVHLNDQEVGRTPLTVPFLFYGVYSVRLEAEGFTSLWTRRKARAPWWELPPLDLVAETVPGTRADLQWHFRMEPRPIADEDALVDRARQLRATLAEGAGPETDDE